MSRRKIARNLEIESNREYELYLRDKQEQLEEEALRQQFIGDFGRLPRNATERANFIRRIQQAEEEQRRRNFDEWAAIQEEYPRKHPEEFKTPEPEQVWKMQWLHRKNPNMGNTSVAEELAMATGNTRKLKKYVRPRVRQGISFNQAINEFAEGGPFVEGVGRGRRNNRPRNGKNLLTVKNAKKLNLLKNYYGEYYDPTPGSYQGYSERRPYNQNGENGAAGGRRRKTRKASRR